MLTQINHEIIGSIAYLSVNHGIARLVVTNRAAKAIPPIINDTPKPIGLISECCFAFIHFKILRLLIVLDKVKSVTLRFHNSSSNILNHSFTILRSF